MGKSFLRSGKASKKELSESDSMLVKILPKRLILAAFLIALGILVDIPWLQQGTIPIILIRATMVAGAIAMAWVARYCTSRTRGETLIVIWTIAQVIGMAVLGQIERTYALYTTGVYQVLVFVAIFLPLRPLTYIGLVAIVGIIWFGIIPVFIPPLEDPRTLMSQLAGYLTYGGMLVVGNRLFMKIRLQEYERRRKLEEKAHSLQELATRDALTGVYNYRMFNETLSGFIANKKDINSFSLCFIDLDDFKAINDEFGHTIGNKVLENVGSGLMDSIRHQDYVFRIGGDEFAALLPNTSAEEAMHMFKDIHESWQSKAGYELRRIPPINCSVGIAAFSPFMITGDALIKAADRALYEAKAQKGNGCRVVVAGQ